MVLLYEPDPDLAPLFRCLLEALGHPAQVAITLDLVPQLAREQPPALAVVRPEAGVDGWAVCRQLQTDLGVPVIGLLPPTAVGKPAADLHVLPLPVDPAALRALVQRLTLVLVT